MKNSARLLLLVSLFMLTACLDRRSDDDTFLPGSHAARAEIQVIANGWAPDLPFEVPQPGTYALPGLGTAGGGTILDVNGEELELEDLFGDKIVLLTFMYSNCTDLNGCPLSTAVFYKIKERFKNTPAFADRLRLISISFDPQRDTPEVMRRYGAGFGEDEPPRWLFLTTASEERLRPILDRYGQMVIREYDEDGNYTNSMSHILRAFLIDRSKNIRQQYSVSFLHDQLITADIKTLLLEVTPPLE